MAPRAPMSVVMPGRPPGTAGRTAERRRRSGEPLPCHRAAARAAVGVGEQTAQPVEGGVVAVLGEVVYDDSDTRCLRKTWSTSPTPGPDTTGSPAPRYSPTFVGDAAISEKAGR